MTERKSLLVGSLPFNNEQEAMTFAINQLGGSLLALPDGEIGEKTPQYPNGKRSAWVMTAINICSEDTENWEVVKDVVRGKDGFPADYNSVQKLRAKHPPSTMHNYLKFGYDDYFKESYPIFQKLKQEKGLDDLKFQVGVPTGLGIAFTMMAPIAALRYTDAFNKRIAYEVNEILKIARDDVIIQIEVPAEVAMAYRLPNFMMNLALMSIFNLVKKINAPAKIGFHLCLGDLNNEALTHAKTLDKMVLFSNKLVDGWLPEYELVYMHYPLAEAVEPPPMNAAFYDSLKHIHLPENVRFVAGFVHEKRSEAELAQIRDIIETVRQHPVDVACSCGLGRRPRPIAEEVIKTTAGLTA